ncbi:MAG TPA: hypothetical protein PLG43_00140 [Spirochaetia bacterium]|jgi:hypothetical protein|nr:hypothetical protein [Spirochaetia bacterium]
MDKRRIFSILAIMFTATTLWAANLYVPQFELVTRGFVNEEDDFELATRGDIKFLAEGGYKFGGKIMLGFSNDNLSVNTEELDPDTAAPADIVNYLNSVTPLYFKLASVTMRNLFSLPLNFTYFIGESDRFATGDDFVTLFGTAPFASRYRGYLYFPETVQYNGIHGVTGTGLAFNTTFDTTWNNTSLYAYQNSVLGSEAYSFDLRSLVNTEFFKMEAFAGATIGPDTDNFGYYRAGLLLFLKAGETGEFFTQIGIPRWDPVDDPFDITLFYFLFEPRVKFDVLSIILTFFWHPSYYLDIQTEESGSADMNLNFLFNDREDAVVKGGIETSVSFTNDESQNEFGIIASPYLTFVTSGVIWNIKVNTKLLPFALDDMVEGFIGIKAEF